MDKLVFMKNWYDAIVEDESLDITPQEMSYILYAAARYAFEEEKINIGEVFGKEFKGLNMAMPNIYSQIEKMKMYGERNQQKNQKYDNEAIKALAAQGFTQKEICERLGYDVEKSKSLSSNRGYTEGRAIYIRDKKEKKELATEIDSFERTGKDCQEIAKTGENCQKIAGRFDF